MQNLILLWNREIREPRKMLKRQQYFLVEDFNKNSFFCLRKPLPRAPSQRDQYCKTIFAVAAVWPDLAKFRHLGKLYQILGKLLRVCLVLGKFLNLLWQYFYEFGQFSIVVSSQIMKNILAIWSHCVDVIRPASFYWVTEDCQEWVCIFIQICTMMTSSKHFDSHKGYF